MRESKGGKKALRVVVNLDEATWLKVQHARVNAQKPMNEIVEELLMQWLAEQGCRSGKGSRRGM